MQTNIKSLKKTMTKTIGKKKELTPEERIQQLEALNREMDKLRPYKKPRGLVLRFKTWEELYDFERTRAAKKI